MCSPLGRRRRLARSFPSLDRVHSRETVQHHRDVWPPEVFGIWIFLVVFISLLNKEPQMENSGPGATLMWTSKLSMAPELNSRCLNKLSLIDVNMKKITQFKIFWPGDPTLEWFHDKKRDSPPRYIYYISIIISYCLFSNIFVFIVALTTQETLQKVALSTKVEPFVFFTNR